MKSRHACINIDTRRLLLNDLTCKSHVKFFTSFPASRLGMYSERFYLSSKNRRRQPFIVGWASCPPMIRGGRDAHPTRLDNLFLGSPLTELKASFTEFKDSLTELKASFTELKASFTEFKDSLTEIKDSFTELKASLTEFKASLMEFKDSFREFKDSFTEFKASLMEFKASLMEFKDSLTEFKASFMSLGE